MSIEVKHLSFSYGEKEVLHDVSFSAEAGEFLSVLGPNGAGKSTLLRCMLGLLRGYSGEVVINGRRSDALSARESARRIAYIPQSSPSVFRYRVLDMVLMGRTSHASPWKSPGRKDVQASLQALERVGIRHLKDHSFHRLSGGEQQLVRIARALAQEAAVLLLDEPTANLDLGNQLLVLKQARQLAREGYTVLQTTHDPERSYLFSNSILALQGGRVAAHGAPREVVTEQLMRELYHADVRLVGLYDDAVRACVPAEFVK